MVDLDVYKRQVFTYAKCNKLVTQLNSSYNNISLMYTKCLVIKLYTIVVVLFMCVNIIKQYHNCDFHVNYEIRHNINNEKSCKPTDNFKSFYTEIIKHIQKSAQVNKNYNITVTRCV